MTDETPTERITPAAAAQPAETPPPAPSAPPAPAETAPPAPAAAAPAGGPFARWRGRRVPLLAVGAALIIGCLCGGGVVAVGAVVSDWGRHAVSHSVRQDGPGPRGFDGPGRYDRRGGHFPRRGDNPGGPPAAPSAVPSAPSAPSAAVPAPAQS